MGKDLINSSTEFWTFLMPDAGKVKVSNFLADIWLHAVS